MLILTRKVGETIRIGDDIVINVIEIRGNQARLGITAPRSVTVHRQEVYEQIQEQNIEASTAQIKDKQILQELWQTKGANAPGQKPAKKAGGKS